MKHIKLDGMMQLFLRLKKFINRKRKTKEYRNAVDLPFLPAGNIFVLKGSYYSAEGYYIKKEIVESCPEIWKPIKKHDTFSQEELDALYLDRWNNLLTNHQYTESQLKQDRLLNKVHQVISQKLEQ